MDVSDTFFILYNNPAARAHLKRAEETSDLNSELDKKRKRKPTCRYSPPSSKKMRAARKAWIESESSTSSSSECVSDYET